MRWALNYGKFLAQPAGRLGAAAVAEVPNFYNKIVFGEEGLYLNSMPGDRANVWLLPLDARPPRRVTDFQDQLVFDFALSPDGKSLAYSRGPCTRDALLVRGFR